MKYEGIPPDLDQRIAGILVAQREEITHIGGPGSAGPRRAQQLVNTLREWLVPEQVGFGVIRPQWSHTGGEPTLSYKQHYEWVWHIVCVTDAPDGGPDIVYDALASGPLPCDAYLVEMFPGQPVMYERHPEYPADHL